MVEAEVQPSSPDAREPWRAPALVLASILSLRVAFALAFPIAPVSDYQAYYEEARGLAGLRPLELEALHAHGPKLFYAAVFRVAGDGLRVVGLVNALLYTASVAFVWAGTRRLLGWRTALAAGGVCALSFSEVYYNNLTCTELPATLCMCALFYLLARGPAGLVGWVLVGLVAGSCIAHRPNMLLVGTLVLAQQWLLTRRFWRALAWATVVQAVALLVALPLCFLNRGHFGRFTPLVANSGALWYGNNPETPAGRSHVYAPIPEELPVGSPERARLTRRYARFKPDIDARATLAGRSPFEASDVKLGYALAYVRSRPQRYLERVRQRVGDFFLTCTYGANPYLAYDPERPDQPAWSPRRLEALRASFRPVQRWYQVLLLTAVLGLVVSVSRWGVRAFLGGPVLPALIVGWYAAPFLLTVAPNRYHVPVLGLLWVYAAESVVLASRLLTTWATRNGTVARG